MFRLLAFLLVLFAASCGGGSHAAEGTWIKTSAGGPMAGVRAQMAPDKLVITSDAVEANGQVIQTSFETDGERIIATPEGKSDGQVIEVLGDDRISVQGVEYAREI